MSELAHGRVSSSRSAMGGGVPTADLGGSDVVGRRELRNGLALLLGVADGGLAGHRPDVRGEGRVLHLGLRQGCGRDLSPVGGR